METVEQLAYKLALVDGWTFIPTEKETRIGSSPKGQRYIKMARVALEELRYTNTKPGVE